jgi:acylpyruvate hydrolase
LSRFASFRSGDGRYQTGRIADGRLVGLGFDAMSVVVGANGSSPDSDHPERHDGPSLDTVQLTAPIPHPGKVIGVGLNYVTHADEAGRELPAFPMLFAKFNNTVAGPSDHIRIPRVSHRIDYEGELAVVIGRRGRYVPEAEAMSHVAGYTVANDVSARDYQMRTREMLSGKSFDGFAPMGPWLVTPDEVGELAQLQLRTWVNGQLRQSATLGEMIFSVPFLISYISDIMTLDPGDIILTGTPSGIGATMNPRRWLRPGDDVKVEIDRIGAIHNHVATEDD